MDISPRGRIQAAALAAHLQRKPPEAIYASPMKRVQQTLAPLLNHGAPPPIVMPDLREVDFGDWTGLGWEGVQEKFGVSAFDWLQQIERDAMPNAESGAAFRATCRAVSSARLSAATPGRTWPSSVMAA